MIKHSIKQTNANLEKLMSDEVDKMYQVSWKKFSSTLMMLNFHFLK